jgi:hypothetical protein
LVKFHRPRLKDSVHRSASCASVVVPETFAKRNASSGVRSASTQAIWADSDPGDPHGGGVRTDTNVTDGGSPADGCVWGSAADDLGVPMRALRLHLGVRSIRQLRGESNGRRHLTQATQWRRVSLSCSVATSMRWRRGEQMFLRRVLPLLLIHTQLVCVVTLRRAVNRKICVRTDTNATDGGSSDDMGKDPPPMNSECFWL